MSAHKHHTPAVRAILAFLVGLLIGLYPTGPVAGHFLLRMPPKRVTSVTRIARRPTKRLTPRRKIPATPAVAPAVLHAVAGMPDADAGFPAFGEAVFPVSRVPNWGSMHTPAEWNRTYTELTDADFVPVPSYDLSELTRPMRGLLADYTDEHRRIVTEKLFYSTRFMGSYDVDAGEFTGRHVGVDLKLALGTPVGSVAGGRVRDIREDPMLGTHVIVEHRHPTDGAFYSVYGHLDAVLVAAGQDVMPGEALGTVGMTGSTSGPHLHLQIDRGAPGAAHAHFSTPRPLSADEAAAHTVNPITFIATY